MSNQYTQQQKEFVERLRQRYFTWPRVAREFNEEFGTSKTSDALRIAYKYWELASDAGEDEVDLKTFQSIRTLRANNHRLRREANLILDQKKLMDEALEQVRIYTNKIGKNPPKIVKIKLPKDTSDRKMTMELMLSDLHFGKKTDHFNLKVAEDRLQQLMDVFIEEYHRQSKTYHVDHIIAALIGDIIESYTMHGLESAVGCEFGNMRQVQESIRCLFEIVFCRLAQLNIPITVPAVTGNHDRTGERRTYNNPGEQNVTYVIYHTLKMLCDQAGFNTTWIIPKGPYCTVDIYNCVALYEHGDNSRSNKPESLFKLLEQRQSQLKIHIHYFRVGHYHEYACYGRGRIIVNESLAGQDSFADVLGFDSQSGQTINLYIDTDKRPNDFFHSFPVYLK